MDKTTPLGSPHCRWRRFHRRGPGNQQEVRHELPPRTRPHTGQPHADNTYKGIPTQDRPRRNSTHEQYPQHLRVVRSALFSEHPQRRLSASTFHQQKRGCTHIMTSSVARASVCRAPASRKPGRHVLLLEAGGCDDVPEVMKPANGLEPWEQARLNFKSTEPHLSGALSVGYG